MPTQEERINILEQSLATFQKEIARSIQVVNENSTILLGLVQTLLQESKQTGLRGEMMRIRVDQLETKLDAHTALLNEHTTVLNGHTAVLNEHTTVLNGHTAVLNEHTALLNEHTARFDRLEALLAQVLERLPKAH